MRFDTQSAYSMSLGLDPRGALDYKLDYVVAERAPEPEGDLEENKSLGSANMSISDVMST